MLTIKKIVKIFGAIIILLSALFVVGSFLPAPVGYDILLVRAKSMEPAISYGSLVVVKSFGSYNRGDIISFKKNNLSPEAPYTTHRVYGSLIDNGRIAYVTKGDGNEFPDSTTVFEDEILGKVVAKVPYAAKVLDFVKNPAGFAVVIIAPLVWIVTDYARKMYKRHKGQNKGQNDV
ncbi:MAG: signal peptidase I [bacterium]|nr:signal peptidase I [bacterium]